MLDDLDKKIKNQIIEHADEEAPKECCGVITNYKGKYHYIKCTNISETPQHSFIMNPKEYADIEDQGHYIEAFVHSHVNLPPTASESDKVSCERSKKPWIIVSTPNYGFNEIIPNGYKPDLIGRKFSHGVLDCYTIIYDYYNDYLNIPIPDFPREERWWQKGQNIYLENFAKAGFHEVNDLQENDVILIQLESDVPNHGAIYLGDTRILHHPMNRLSHKTVYGGYWRKNTWCYLRHEHFLNND